MKKMYLILMAALLASGLGANVTGYYPGNTGNGFNCTIGSACNGLQNGMVPQPASPAPPEGNRWLAYQPGSGVANYISLPVSVYNPAQGVVEFWSNSDGTCGGTGVLFCATQAGFAQSMQLIWAGGVMYMQYFDGGSNHNITNNTFPQDGTYHLLRLEWDAVSIRLFQDTVSVGTTVAMVPFTPDYVNIIGSQEQAFGAQTASCAGIDAFMIADDPAQAYSGPGLPTPTPTNTKTRTATTTPSYTRTPTVTVTMTKTPTLTRTNSFTSSPTLTNTPPWTHTPTPTKSPTITNTFSQTRTITSSMTRSPTVTVTPTANPGTLTFNYAVTNQVYVTWPGTNINPGNGSTVYVAYGPKSGSTYPNSAGGGYDPVHDVFFATVPRAWPLYAKGRIINGQGSFSTVEGFAYGPYTLTPSPTISVTRTVTPVVTVTPSVTKTFTPTVTATPVVTNVTKDTSVSGQTYITWQSTANVDPSMDVYVQYGTTTAYGFQAGGGYDADDAVFFATVPRDANTSPFHFRCVIHNSKGTSRSADFTAP